MSEAYIREIFFSIQGEGPHIGEPQLFVRFCGCNLSCQYCDTDFDISSSKKYSVKQLLDEINSFGKNLVISLTGGEPLLSTEFLKEFLPEIKKFNHHIYLETNGTLPNKLKEIIDFIDIVAADIKLESATGQKTDYKAIENFFEIAKNKELFAKVVFDKNITEAEINKITEIGENFSIEIILQPKMDKNNFSDNIATLENIFYNTAKKYSKVRLIPQMHKFLNVR